jgi:hypothetical protein
VGQPLQTRHVRVLQGAVWASLRFRASYAPPRRQFHHPAGSRSEKFVWQEHTADDTDRYDIDTREAHALLGTEPNDTLMRIKLNYLLRCRMFHPDVGGNAAMFYKITVAYERIMFDRGVESRHGRISFSDVLGPRPKFDTTPLIPDDLTEDERRFLESDGIERTTTGEPVPWARSGRKWKNSEEESLYLSQQAEGGEAAVEAVTADAEPEEKPLSDWEVDAQRKVRHHQALAYNTQSAAKHIRQQEEMQREKEEERKSAAAAAAPKSTPIESLDEGSSGGVAAAAGVTPVGASTSTELVENKNNTQESAVAKTDEVTEVDAAEHPDDGIVVIKAPKKALFNQQPLSKWSNDQLMKRWSNAPDRLSHDDEEATAREIIERSINESGGQMTTEQKDFMMTHLVERSDSVAGIAARSATEVMQNTKEKRTVVFEGMVLVQYFVMLFIGIIIVGTNYMHFVIRRDKNPNQSEHISFDTMLPWWGNDAEYERTVKRLFVEEWRRARMAARRQQTFQDGVARESMESQDRVGLESNIFEVTSERLREIRAKAERPRGEQEIVGDRADA